MTTRRTPELDTRAVMIIGAGVSGLGTAAQLLETGVRDILVLEREAAVGIPSHGDLPGSPCDIPSILYPYTFGDKATWPEWSSQRPTAVEIGRYAQELARRFALEPYIRFGQEVTRLEYDQSGARWIAQTGAGHRFAARAVVVAVGPVPVARTPDVRGIERFGGTTIHTADWNDGVDVTGKRVAIVGSGASAVQLVPELAKRAARLKVFQRTPRWTLPWPGHASAAWDRALLRTVPFSRATARYAVRCVHEPWALNRLVRPALVTALEQFAGAHMRHQVDDPWDRRLLTPTYVAGARPTLVSSDYYPALQQAHVKLLHWPIANVSEAGLRTSDALEHQVDIVVLATGSDIAGVGTRFPIIGRQGRTLARERTDRSGSYKGVNVSGFPNMFLVPGPGARPERSPALLYMTDQIDYTVRAVTAIAAGAVRSLDVRGDVQRSYVNALRQRLAGSVWQANGIRDGRHITSHGLDATVYPGLATEYPSQLSTVRLADYTVEHAHVAAVEGVLNGSRNGSSTPRVPDRKG